MSKNSFKVNNSLHLRPQDTLPSDPEDGDLVQQNNTVYARANGQWKDLGANFNDPMTTRGDMLFRDAGNQTARLPIGVNGSVLKSDGQDVSWGAFDAAGVFNYIANPYAQNDTSDSSTSVTSGSFTVDRTTTASELPSTNDAAWKLSGAGVTVGDYVAIHSSRAIALTDKTVGSMGVKLVDINGSANDHWKAQLYSTTDGEYVGQELEFNAGTNTYVIDAFTVPEKQYYIHMIAKVASPSAVSAEFFIQSEAESQVSYQGKWNEDELSVGNLNSPVYSQNRWRINGESIDIQIELTASSGGVNSRIFIEPPTGYTPLNQDDGHIVFGGSFHDGNGVHNFVTLKWVAASSRWEGYRQAVNGSDVNSDSLVGAGVSGARHLNLDFSFAAVELSNNVIPTVSDLQYENAELIKVGQSGMSALSTTTTRLLFKTTNEISGFTENLNVFTAKAKGRYWISAKSRCSGLQGNVIMEIYKNASTLIAEERTATSSFGRVEDYVHLDAGDTIEIFIGVTTGSGVVVDNDSGTRLNIFRVSDYSARAAGLPLNVNQTKILSASFSGNAVSIPDLKFNNLTIGQAYKVSGQIVIRLDAATNQGGVNLSYDGTNTSTSLYGSCLAYEAGLEVLTIPFSFDFYAVTSELYFMTSSLEQTNDLVFGNGTRQYSFATLTEVNNTVETTKFS